MPIYEFVTMLDFTLFSANPKILIGYRPQFEAKLSRLSISWISELGAREILAKQAIKLITLKLVDIVEPNRGVEKFGIGKIYYYNLRMTRNNPMKIFRLYL